MVNKKGPASAAPPREDPADRAHPPSFMFQPMRTQALASLSRSLALVKTVSLVAPVGYDKTVLMSMLFADLQDAGRKCIWLALDDRDTSVESQIRHLEAQLNPPGLELHTTQALFRGQEPMARRIDALIERINEFPLPITIFIDNLNHCDDAEAGPFLDRLIFTTRASVQLVLSSTSDIPLNMSQAQLEGRIQQVGPAELSFNIEDVGNLLGPRLRDAIVQEGVEEVTARTEGWPAAVRMAQIILSSAAQPRQALKVFSGSDEGLAHLLNRQVISGFSPELREFLLSIAQLRTFCRDLCSHATNSAQAAGHLDYLLQRNAFVIPLDSNGKWYRLHGLFRDYLLAEAERIMPVQRRQEILTRAASWCTKNRYWAEAIDYALASGAPASAGAILDHTAQMFVRDRSDFLQFIKWIEALHEEGYEPSAEVEYWFAWALCFHRRYDYARHQSASLAAQIQNQAKDGEHSAPPELQRRLALLRASIASLADHFQDAHRLALQWLADARTGADDPFDVIVVHCIESCYFANSFRFVEARRAILLAQEAVFQTNSAYVEGRLATYAALIPLYEGDYAGGYTDLVQRLEMARASLGDEAGICGTLAMVAAKCAAGMARDEEARRLLEFGIKTSHNHGFLEAIAAGLDAAVLLWTGPQDTRVSIPLLREIARAYPSRLSIMLSCFLTRRLLVLGRSEEARTEAARAGVITGSDLTPGKFPWEQGIAHLEALINMTQIDLLIADGRFKQAGQMIEEEIKRAKAVECAASQVELVLAAMVIAVRSGQDAMATRHITRAIRLAAPRQIIRPFNDHAEILAMVIADTKVNAWGFTLNEERQFFVDLCQRLPISDPSLNDRLASLHQTPQLLGQLTAREQELFSLVDAGLSNQQIADYTDISLTTVKWHLQNVYGKLGATSRATALARARVLNLLPR